MNTWEQKKTSSIQGLIKCSRTFLHLAKNVMLMDLWIKHSASLPFWVTDKCNIWLVWRVQVACQREMQVLWFSCQWAITTWQGSLGQSVLYLRSFCIWRFWEWWVIWWATLQPLPRHSGSVRCHFPPSLKCLEKISHMHYSYLYV